MSLNVTVFQSVETTARTVLRIALLALCLLLGSGFATLVAYRAFPLPRTLMDRVQHFSRSNAEVLFIGSSFTGLGIDPAVLREHGVKGFVFGVPAMGGEELEYVLRVMLERRPESLRSVWVEVKQWEPGAGNGRSRHWRTLSPIGRGLMAFQREGVGAWIIEPHEGFRPRPAQLFDFTGHARWIDPDEGDIDWPLQSELREMVRSFGLEAVFFLPPTRIEPEPYVFEVEDFNDPTRFPTLFEDEVRWDPTHLNLEGARRWSIMLAERIRRRARP